MRCLTRIGLALLGLATAAPVAWADDPAASTGSTPHTHRKWLFGREKLCAACQSARLQAQGINMPVPAPIPAGAVVMDGGVCTTCQSGQGMAVSNQMPGQSVVYNQMPGQSVVYNQMPGQAVVGGSAPGFAVVGADPTPIGLVQARGGARAARGALSDRSVMPTSIPPAADPISPPGSKRPHIISHMLGVSAIGREHREEVQKAKGQKHAAIRYDNEAAKVNEVPTSVVYGRRWW